MTEHVQLTEAKEETMYTFRFGTSDKFVHLTGQQLDRIPYLAALVTHTDDFLSTRNENGDYVLNSPIHYNCFMAILHHSIISEEPYTLFNKLREDENILEALQLLDYLGINSFSPPLLKGKQLTLSNAANNQNEKRHVKYHRANLSKARNTAAEFIIALSMNKYDLSDSSTVKLIFSLNMVIFSNPNVFSSRFRQHTLTVAKEYYIWLFSCKQRNQLPTIQQIARDSKIDSWMYLYDDNEPLPENFQNAFAWKGVYTSVTANDTDHYDWRSSTFIDIGRTRSIKSILMRILLGYTEQKDFQRINLDSSLPPVYRERAFSVVNENVDNEDLQINEAKLPRSGRFNTLPKRPYFNQCKHRSGPKAQKYR